MRRPHGAAGVGRSDRSVSLERPLQDASTDMRLLERAAELAEELEQIVGRMPPGSFTQDPGMRAPDEFQDVASAGYNQNAQRVAERGGAKEYATSVEEAEAEAEADTMRNRVGMALMALSAVGGPLAAVGRAAAPMSAFQRGTFGQVGANPGLGRSIMGTPSARQAAANRGLHPQYGTSIGRPAVRPAGSANDMSGVMDNALAGTPWGRAMNLGGSLQRGPRLMDTAMRQWLRG